uniref:Uncharacterized protein n=1 Tax=Arcella intermedia TaxID=1963864 RepID=A0A6B2LYL8_9EUKA
MSKEWGVPFFESSAMKRVNVEEVFFALVREFGFLKKDEGKKPKRRGCLLL